MFQQEIRSWKGESGTRNYRNRKDENQDQDLTSFLLEYEDFITVQYVLLLFVQSVSYVV